MKRKKALSIALCLTLLTGSLTACNSQGNESKEKEKNNGGSEAMIELEVGYTDEALDNFRQIIDGFTEETGISVDMITPGSDYETVMKTRMASGDMPDVFVTHGWSVGRYKEYLLELNDQEWYKNVGDSIKSVIEDEDGRGYVLCVSQGINGLEYNADVLAEAGVDPLSIRTVEDFMDACEKVKGTGATPIFLGGKDYWTSASLMDNLAPVYYTAEGCAYPLANELKDGSFDWESDGSYLFDDLREMIEKGYFNDNFATADEVQGFEAFANGECGFLIGGLALDRIKSYNEDADIGVMPMPSTTNEGKSQYLVGEGSAFGIWKDSEYIEESKQLLEYLAKPEAAEKILEVDGQMPALTNIDAADSATYTAFTKSEGEFREDICYDNLFDREYLPSGMWSVLSDSVMEVFMDPTETGASKAAETMQDNYIEKMDAAG